MAIIVVVMTGILLGGPYVMRAINAPFKSIEEGAMDSAREDIKQGNGAVGPVPPCACTGLLDAGCGDGTGGCAKTRKLFRRTCAPLGCEVDLIAAGIITVMQECRDDPTNTCCLDPVSTGFCGAAATHIAGGCAAGEMEVKKMCGSPAQVPVYACLPDPSCTNDCEPIGGHVTGWCDVANHNVGLSGMTPVVYVNNGHCNDTPDMRCKAQCIVGAYSAGGGCLLQCDCTGQCAAQGWECGLDLCGGPCPDTCPPGWSCSGHTCIDPCPFC